MFTQRLDNSLGNETYFPGVIHGNAFQRLKKEDIMVDEWLVYIKQLNEQTKRFGVCSLGPQ